MLNESVLVRNLMHFLEKKIKYRLMLLIFAFLLLFFLKIQLFITQFLFS